ncbi:ABC transporter ATP-binding protein [Gulosibacter chungangensis]|uniref:ABC transporter ATP-binding protein n=2 Tax=Gulosibacter chungangensis TaxID=979746 RepID=A0A7J5BC67_9MICO|nr:ABC transporter ATP-binding protein [Gulosibacter chungangensis]
MPPVWRGKRRWLIVSLVVLGVVQAALALVMAFSVDALLTAAGSVADASTGSAQVASTGSASGASTGSANGETGSASGGGDAAWLGMGGLVAAVLGVGLARWFERIVAERLGQDYVYEQRRRLITSALGEFGNRSLGVIVTRASNDLTAVRNWIAQGIVPLATALPLIITVIAVLAFTNWPVALAIFIPLSLMTAVLPFLSAMAHNRARTLRRYRGRMSAHIADTVRAGESIRVAGAMRRELNAVDRNSAKVVDAAVARARVTGFVRSLTVTAASLCTVAVVFLALRGVINVAEVASIMTLLGVMATPLSDLGRVVEYRQNYRAARHILAPMLAAANDLKREERRREKAWKAEKPKPVAGHRGLTVEGLSASGVTLPPLDAKPGERILLDSEHPSHLQATIKALLEAHHDAETQAPRLLVSGFDFAKAPARKRRELVGFASDRIPLERGSVQRLVSYRDPNAIVGEVRWMLQRVGLGPRVDNSPAGLNTKLKNGGSPWNSADVARLKLARSLLGAPPLLVVEHIDAALDASGLATLREILDGYPGVVLFASQHPEQVVSHYRAWQLDGLDAKARALTAATVGRESGAAADFEPDQDDE